MLHHVELLGHIIDLNLINKNEHFYPRSTTDFDQFAPYFGFILAILKHISAK